MANLRAGGFRPGWSRLVMELRAPLAIESAAMETGQGGATVRLRLVPATPAEFATAAAQPEPPEWRCPLPSKPRNPPREGRGRSSSSSTPVTAASTPARNGTAIPRPR